MEKAPAHFFHSGSSDIGSRPRNRQSDSRNHPGTSVCINDYAHYCVCFLFSMAISNNVTDDLRSHRLNTILDSDRVLVLSDGKVRSVRIETDCGAVLIEVSSGEGVR